MVKNRHGFLGFFKMQHIMLGLLCMAIINKREKMGWFQKAKETNPTWSQIRAWKPAWKNYDRNYVKSKARFIPFFKFDVKVLNAKYTTP